MWLVPTSGKALRSFRLYTDWNCSFRMTALLAVSPWRNLSFVAIWDESCFLVLMYDQNRFGFVRRSSQTTSSRLALFDLLDYLCSCPLGVLYRFTSFGSLLCLARVWAFYSMLLRRFSSEVTQECVCLAMSYVLVHGVSLIAYPIWVYLNPHAIDVFNLVGIHEGIFQSYELLYAWCCWCWLSSTER